MQIIEYDFYDGDIHIALFALSKDFKRFVAFILFAETLLKWMLLNASKS